MSNHPIEGMLGVSMEKIREMIDVNTIVGDPITTLSGTTVIPVSKVSFGFGSGGSDIPAKSSKDLFGGGAGAGVTINPLAFLVINSDGVQLLQMDSKSGGADKIIESIPDTIDKLIKVFNKNKDKKDKAENECKD